MPFIDYAQIQPAVLQDRSLINSEGGGVYLAPYALHNSPLAGRRLCCSQVWDRANEPVKWKDLVSMVLLHMKGRIQIDLKLDNLEPQRKLMRINQRVN